MQNFNFMLIKKISLVSLFFFTLFSPYLVLAQQGNTPTSGSGNTGIVYVCTGGPAGECTFDDLIRAVKRVVDWGTIFAIQFSVVVIAYAGFKYMISGDKPGERAAANQMMLKVVKGMIFILLAWVIVRLILSALGVNDPNIPLFLNN